MQNLVEGGTILGVLLTALGFGRWIKNVDKRVDSLSGSVVYTDRFEEFKDAYLREQDAQNETLQTIDGKIDKILEKG